MLDHDIKISSMLEARSSSILKLDGLFELFGLYGFGYILIISHVFLDHIAIYFG